mmetsp:Transcript_17436/g.29233  ORF Transcript_17436/g.29233 Transcript_17436/m.29233 type:complete len:90 (+) Transcript_17436:1591-1860(+)
MVGQAACQCRADQAAHMQRVGVRRSCQVTLVHTEALRTASFSFLTSTNISAHYYSYFSFHFLFIVLHERVWLFLACLQRCDVQAVVPPS